MLPLLFTTGAASGVPVFSLFIWRTLRSLPLKMLPHYGVARLIPVIPLDELPLLLDLPGILLA